MLPSNDSQFLAERSFNYSASSDGGMTCVLFSGYPLPQGYDRPTSDLLLRLSPGYPDVAPDMWWFDPPVNRADGEAIPQTNVIEPYLGRTWQRWSRHLDASHWRAGIDGIENFLALLRKELEKCAQPIKS